MTSKQRVQCAFRHCEPDRVPINYAANSEIDAAFKQHFGLEVHDSEGLRRQLGVDFRHAWAPYTGPQLHPTEANTRVNIWGAPMRWVEHTGGGYWDYSGWPLADASLAEVEAWPMPDPDEYDYASVARACRDYSDYFIFVGGHGVGDIINQTGMLRTMSQVLIDLTLDDPAGLRLIDRRHEIELAVLRRSLEAADGQADMVLIGEDLGAQRGPLLSLSLFRRHIRPRLQRYVDLALEFGLPVMMHSDGSVDWVYADLIEMGITAVDAVQIECAGMEPHSLKQRFGQQLSFHGVWPTTGAMAAGTVSEAVDEVRAVLAAMMPGGGFAVSPAHCIQSITPVENLVAAYDAIHTFGRY